MDDFTILQSTGKSPFFDPWVVVGVLFLITLVLGYFGWQYYIKYIKDRPPGVQCKHGWKCLPGNIGFQELSPDPSLSTPQAEVYLAKFVKAAGAGPPVCLPMWYCLRYVNVKTGGYSKFGKWIKLPVNAGADKLPYPSGGTGKLGKDSCTFNQPTIGVKSLKYQFIPGEEGDKNIFIAANLHRYTGKTESDVTPPGDPNSGSVKTEIVGYLLPYSDTNKIITYAWADVMKNPCKNRCFRCKGC